MKVHLKLPFLIYFNFIMNLNVSFHLFKTSYKVNFILFFNKALLEFVDQIKRSTEIRINVINICFAIISMVRVNIFRVEMHQTAYMQTSNRW